VGRLAITAGPVRDAWGNSSERERERAGVQRPILLVLGLAEESDRLILTRTSGSNNSGSLTTAGSSGWSLKITEGAVASGGCLAEGLATWCHLGEGAAG